MVTRAVQRCANMRLPPKGGERSFALARAWHVSGLGGNRLCARGCFSPGRRRGRTSMHVDSTAISEIDYDAERAKLLVRFASGERYVYVGVPDEIHRSFVKADSKGRCFQLHVRDRYPFNRLDS